jgi:hypothetical protein
MDLDPDPGGPKTLDPVDPDPQRQIQYTLMYTVPCAVYCTG